MLRFTGNPRGSRVAVLIFVIAFFAVGAAWCTRSDAEEVLSAGFGIATAGSERCFESMLVSQSFGNQEWLGFLATHGDSLDCRSHKVKANLAVGVIRTVHRGPWTLGIGAGVLEHGDIVIGPSEVWDAPGMTADRIQLSAALLVRRRIGRYLSADLLHLSTGGSTWENRGLNVIALSARASVGE